MEGASVASSEQTKLRRFLPRLSRAGVRPKPTAFSRAVIKQLRRVILLSRAALAHSSSSTSSLLLLILPSFVLSPQSAQYNGAVAVVIAGRNAEGRYGVRLDDGEVVEMTWHIRISPLNNQE